MRRFFTFLFGLMISLNLSAQNCLDGFNYLGELDGHHYYLSQTGTHPSIAYSIVDGMGYYLASITSAAENSWLASRVPGYVLIGLNDLDNEGQFAWHSGEPVSYTNWWFGEPNNQGNEDYTVINFGALGRWNDIPDYVAPLFVIEIVAADDDCDGVDNLCDLCPGGDDSVDNNGDGLPDCAYYPGYENLSPDWICGANKVLVCHRPPDNPSNSHNICISKNAIPDHTGHGDYIGPCTACGNALQSNGNTNDRYYRNGLDPDDLTIFPNPASEEINIRLPESNLETIVTIFDIQGRSIWTQKVSPNADRMLTISGQLIGHGIFAVVARTGESVRTERLVVQR